MKTRKELLMQRHDDATHIYREAADEVTRLTSQVKSERNTIDDLTAKYNEECRKAARGDNAEIPPLLAERDRRSDRLRGLEILLKEATERLAPISAEHVAASQALQEVFDREERERLDAAITEAQKSRTNAQAALNEAEKAVNAAVWARSQFLRKLGDRTRREHLIAQGRA